MAVTARHLDGTAHQRGADAAALLGRVDRERPKQQGCLAAGLDVPEPDGADHAAALDRDEGQALGRQPAIPQLGRRLAVPLIAIGAVEQRFARCLVNRPFLSDRDHVRSRASGRRRALGAPPVVAIPG